MKDLSPSMTMLCKECWLSERLSQHNGIESLGGESLGGKCLLTMNEDLSNH